MTKRRPSRAVLCFLLVAFALFLAGHARAERTDPPAGGVTFNFVDVDIPAVAKFVSEVTGKNFIFDERVRGKITIIAPTKLSPEDAFNLFSSVLDLKGFALLPSGVDAYKIAPASEARQSGVQVTRQRPPVNDNYIARLIELKNISSDDALRFLQPVVSRTGYIASFGPGNFLLVLDTGLNVQKILGILSVIDRPTIGEEPEVVFLEHSSAEDVAKILNEGIQKQARAARQPAASKAIAERRLNAVVIFGSKSEREAMKRLIKHLDLPPKETQGTINVYFLENADAEEMADVLTKLVEAGTAKPGQPGAPPAAARGGVFRSLDISITPDKATNSLVIVASPADYKSLEAVIKKLDIKRRQVYVEAMIVEASLDKLRDLGSQWRAITRHNGEPVFITGVGTIDSSTMASIVQGLSGLTAGGLAQFFNLQVTDPSGETVDLSVPQYAALFQLDEFRDAVNVLSTPQILTSDNAEAEIVVAENVPFISKIQRGLTTGDEVPFASIERQDVGIILRITPQITEGDFVKLEVYQEISNVLQTSEQVFTTVGPTTRKRSTNTVVSVKDKQTVVIGGLMQQREEVTETRVPLLHRIPLLGWLFKFKTTSHAKTNLLVFLTPHVVKDAEDLREITHNKRRAFVEREGMYAPGELIVKFVQGTSPEEALAVIHKHEAEVLKAMEDLGIYRIKLRKGQSVKDALEEFGRLPEVRDAEPNFELSLEGLKPVEKGNR
ncbi:MAG: type II secretion system secretin GspD [Nitrospirota bacterium]